MSSKSARIKGRARPSLGGRSSYSYGRLKSRAKSHREPTALDPTKLTVSVFEETDARVARLILAGKLARDLTQLASPRNAQLLFRKVADSWPPGNPVDCLVTFGGFQRFNWPLPVTVSRDEVEWADLVRAGALAAKECLKNGGNCSGLWSR
jgi:hypothetical protein